MVKHKSQCLSSLISLNINIGNTKHYNKRKKKKKKKVKNEIGQISLTTGNCTELETTMGCHYCSTINSNNIETFLVVAEAPTQEESSLSHTHTYILKNIHIKYRKRNSYMYAVVNLTSAASRQPQF